MAHFPPRTNSGGVAVFFDIENIIGQTSRLGLPVKFKPVCEKLKEFGVIRSKASFGDIIRALNAVGNPHKIGEIRRELASNLILSHDTTYLGYKNSADAHIITSALSMVYENSNISHIAVVTQDRDYAPLYGKLRELGIIVIVLSIDRESTSSIVADAVDYLIYYEDLPDIRPASALETSRAEQNEEDGLEMKTGNELEDYTALVLRAAQILQDEGRQILGATLQQKMRQLRSDFDVTRVGKFRFKDFLLDLESAGYIEVNASNSGDMAISLKKSLTEVQADGDGPSRELNAETACKLYKEVLENILRTSIPSCERRKLIIETAEETFEPNIRLKDWATSTHQKMLEKDASVSQATIFKTMLSLYFSRAFYVEVDPWDRTNPCIVEFVKNPPEFFETLSRHYVGTIIRKGRCELLAEGIARLIFDEYTAEDVNRCEQWMFDEKLKI